MRGALGSVTRQVAVASLMLGTFAGVLPNTLIPMALQRMEAAPASLVQAAGPLIITLLAGLLLPGEKPSPRMLAGVGVGFLGIALVVGSGGLGGGTAVGAALMSLSTVVVAVNARLLGRQGERRLAALRADVARSDPAAP